MGPIGCPETSVRNYHYSLRNDPEQRSSNKPLKMGPIGCTETSVRNYHYSLRNDPEQRSSNEYVVMLAMKIFRCCFQRQDSFGSLFHQIRLKRPHSKYAVSQQISLLRIRIHPAITAA
jgi:hypothetical protein